MLGWTPLHYAVYGAHLKGVRLFKKHGVSLDSAATDGLTPLHLAIIRGARRVAAYLIHQNCDTNLPDMKGNSPLHHCVDVHTMEVTGWTEKERMEMVDFLCNHGANTEAANQDGQLPLHWATKNCAGEDTVRLLVAASSSGVNAGGDGGLTALHQAVTPEMIRLLVNMGANPNAMDSEGQSPLHVHIANAVLLRSLLKVGADANRQDHADRMPLHVACSADHPDLQVLSLLADKTHYPNQPDKAGNSPLHVLCLNKYKTVCDRETDHVCYKHVRKDYDPPIDILLARGADKEKVNGLGQTPVQICLSKHLTNRLRFLVLRGCAMPKRTKGKQKTISPTPRVKHHFVPGISRDRRDSKGGSLPTRKPLKSSLAHTRKASLKHSKLVTFREQKDTKPSTPVPDRLYKKNQAGSDVSTSMWTTVAQSMVEGAPSGRNHTPLPQWVSDSAEDNTSMFCLLPNWLVKADQPNILHRKGGGRRPSAIRGRLRNTPAETTLVSPSQTRRLSKEINSLRIEVKDIEHSLRSLADEGEPVVSKPVILKQQVSRLREEMQDMHHFLHMHLTDRHFLKPR